MNPYKLIIELPKSDGFHTHDNLHLATTVKRRVEASLATPGAIEGCTVTYSKEPQKQPSPAASETLTQDALVRLYKRLCDMHMDTVLTHGAQVGQGLALAIKEVHQLLPADVKQAAITEWAEKPAATKESS